MAIRDEAQAAVELLGCLVFADHGQLDKFDPFARMAEDRLDELPGDSCATRRGSNVHAPENALVSLLCAGLRAVTGNTDEVGVAAMSASGGYGTPRVCAGIVGHADLPVGARVREVLEAMIVAGGGRFRGIRFIASTDPDQSQWGATAVRPKGLLLDRQVREGFAQLAPLGLSFDAWVYHPQLADLVDLARAFPATPIVLNHVGGPIGLGRYKGKRDAVFADWGARIRELAACPNVHVKLGGLGMRMFGFDVHEGELPPSSEQLAAAWRPYIETCIAAFGADRAMFESNFPVDKGSYGYGVFWNACKRLAQGASAAEKASLFHGTASRVYRLGL